MKLANKTGLQRCIPAIAAFATIATVTALAFLVFPLLRSPQQVAAEAAPPSPSAITAIAEKRTLSAKVVMRAAVVPGVTVNLKPSDALLAAGMIVTAVPSASSQTIGTGDVVVEANGEPLIALSWPFPAYRDIHAGDTGPDVQELQKSLAALGYATGASGTFDSITRGGLKRLYEDRGYDAPTAELADPASSPTTTSSAADGGAGNASSSRQNSVRPEIMLPARHVVVLPNSRNAITDIPLKVGQKIDAETLLAKLDGQASTILASTTPDRAMRITDGAVGTLTGAAGEQYPVKVASVASTVDDIDGLGQGVKIDLIFTDPTNAAPITAAGATLKLEIPTGSPVEGLALPITAIYSTPDGTSYVIPGSAPSDRIDVTIGASVDGWVEIRPGSDLKEGDAVVLGTNPG